MTDHPRSKEDQPRGAPANGPTATLRETVTAPLMTVHLPPDRAVITTPAMIGLMERCVAMAEAAGGEIGRQSRAVEVRHRAGLRAGEECVVSAVLELTDGGERRWRVRMEAADGRLIGEGTITRGKGESCRS